MFASILCLGLDTRTPRVHVPAFTGSYLPAVLRAYLRIAEYDINGRPIMKAHAKEDVHASQPSNESGFLANA
jgi:hypothetical protein